MGKLVFSNRAKDIITLFSGTAISQLVSVIGTFVLAKLYFPSDFGVFASFLSLVNIVAIGFNLRYEMAIILPKRDSHAIHLVYLCFLVSVILLGLGGLLSLFLPNQIGQFSFLNQSNFSGLNELLPFVLPILITAWFIANFNVLNYYSVRKGQFKTISKALLIKASVVFIIQLILFYIFNGPTGLIFGQLIGVGGAMIFFLFNHTKDFRVVKFSKSKICVLKRRYIDFVKYTFPGAIANTIALELNSIFILTVFASAEAGFYFFSIKLLGAPLALIGKSYSQVYLRDANVERLNTGKADKIFLKVLKELGLFSILCLLLGMLLINDIIEIVFGEKWAEAGEYSLILLPLFMIRLVSSSLSGTMSVFEKQKMMLLNNMALLFLLIIIYLITIYFKFNIYNFLLLYTVLYSIIYITFIFIYYKTALNSLRQ